MTSFANGRTTTITTGPTEPSMGRLPTSGSWQRKTLPACHRSPETLHVVIGAPGGIRTPDFLVRSQALYPTELRARREGESVCRNERHSDPGARSVSY